MKRVLITGAMGLAGTCLAADLIKEGYEVYGLDRIGFRNDGMSPPFTHVFTENITDEGDVARILREVAPDQIYHLAAVFSEKSLSRGVQELFDINVKGTLNVLEISAAGKKIPRILIASSSAVYGDGSEKPIDEHFPLKPVTFYGISKVIAEELGRFYSRVRGLEVTISRAFNNTAPGEARILVASEFAAQVSEMERGERTPVLKVGNIDAIRDFTDTRDVVQAYRLLMEKGESGGVYNISSGVGRPIGDIIDVLQSISTVNFKVIQEKSRLRPSGIDVSRQIGNPDKIRNLTSWVPEISFQDTIGDLLDYWRGTRVTV